MDLSIRLITPEIMRELGAEDYDRGVPIDGHGMTADAHAIVDWQSGWLWREYEVQAGQQLEAPCPP